MAGLTRAGFVPKTRTEVLEDLEADARDLMGGTISTDADTPLGQVLGLVAGIADELWSVLGDVSRGQGLLTASGSMLDGLVPGTRRHTAQPSRVQIRCSGSPGTIIPQGSQIQLSGTSTRWTSQASLTLDATGQGTVEFVADETGPIEAPAGSSWSTATPIGGWLGAANIAPAVVGANRETDAGLRSRSIATSNGASASSAPGIRAGVIGVAGVTECVVIENDAAVADTEGRPPNSIEVVVRGGADAAIAAAIWARKPAGRVLTSVVPLASQVTESIIDGNGDPKPILFSREDIVDVYVEVDYRPLVDVFPANGEDLIEQAILDFGAALSIGTPVHPPNVVRAIGLAFLTPVFQRLTLRMGVSAMPTEAATVPTGRAQLAAFDADRITVERV